MRLPLARLREILARRKQQAAPQEHHVHVHMDMAPIAHVLRMIADSNAPPRGSEPDRPMANPS